MTIKRLTKADHPQSFGTFRPVGHVLVALANDQVTDEAAQALRAAGFGAEDILHYSAAEEAQQMDQMLDHASDLAGFGYEVTLMRRYKALAREGCSWLLVYAPDAPHAGRVAEVAQRFGARLAVKYHRMVEEDLI